MATAYVNIGSNTGDRRALLARAVACIEGIAEGAPVRVSAVVESEPWGYQSPHPFLNIGAAFATPLGAVELFSRLMEAQDSVSPAPHRDDRGGYIDRAIDIDLIALDDIIVDTPRLTLPHPRMHLRPFVLIPMAELAPLWRHPVTGLTPSQMLAKLP